MSMGTIFIQIASYRDPQLKPTLKDLLEKAKYPEKLWVAIAWQHSNEDTWDELDEYKNDPRFRILDIDHKEAKGVCWARNQVQQLYDSEDYTLQIDSHMRFEENWDETLVGMLEGLMGQGYEKPLLTSYVPSFDPDNDPSGRVRIPWRMNFDRFIPEGAIFFLPAGMPEFETLEAPVRARFYSAHFCFTVGSFAREVQHNPEYYFHGEEISIAVRAFTHGYDLFHPHKVVVWHEYTRRGRTKQWDDDKTWGDKNSRSHLLNRKLFGMDGETQEGHDGPYGFGKERTLREYERYAGISFSRRSVQKETINHSCPPNPTYASEEEWLDSFSRIFRHCIDVSYASVPEADYDFWVVAFHDEKGETIFRKDADKDEIARLKSDPDKYCKVWREFQTTVQPKKWVVWPHSTSKGWCDKIEGKI
jgi:glycosyltransferase involved in cell wall biosynthesis